MLRFALLVLLKYASTPRINRCILQSTVPQCRMKSNARNMAWCVWPILTQPSATTILGMARATTIANGIKEFVAKVKVVGLRTLREPEIFGLLLLCLFESSNRCSTSL